MPNTKSAKKRLRQNIVRRYRNRSIKSDLRTQLRKLHVALKDGSIEQSEKQFRLVAQKVDRAAENNIIHPNRAGRIKSRLQRRMKAAKQA